MQVDKIKEIIDLMTANGLSEFEMEENGARLVLKKEGKTAVLQMPAPQAAPVASAVAASVAPAAPPAIDETRFAMVKAPFVGTFYHAPAPDAEPYVTVGQEVMPETVLCIIEAMKVMNEIKAEVKGVIREIMAENAHAVQFGQPLFKIEKK